MLLHLHSMFSHISDSKIKTLLQKVLDVYNYKIVHSKDCDNLAAEISIKCGENISGSTVKRLFGFIKTTSSPSKYTLNILAKYIDSVDFTTFITHQTNNTPKTVDNSVEEYIDSNLFNNKLYSYQNGWDKLDAFLKSKFNFTAIIGEGGTGKSAFLASYLVCIKDKNLNSKVLYRIPAKNIKNYLTDIDEYTQLLIIDDLEETAYNFTELRNSLILILQLQVRFKNLKIILSIRPYTWIKLIELVNVEQQKRRWFGVNFNAPDPIAACNVNTFIESIEQASSTEILQTPLFNSLLNNIDDEIINDWVLLRAFFTKNIINTAYHYEKQSFLNRLLEQTNYGINGTRIKRQLIQDLIIKYKKPHLDLVSFNIITEHKETNKYGAFTSYYSFGKSMYFDYQILTKLLTEFNGFNLRLIEYITSNYEYERRLGLLKLAVSHALHYVELNVVELFNIKLEEYERQALMVHLAQQIRGNKKLQQTLLPLFVQSPNGRKYFIERWIDEENLKGFYGQILQKYLTIVTDNQSIIFGNALLYYSAYLNNDCKNCIKYHSTIDKTDETKTAIHPFVIGRKYMTLLLEEYRTKNSYSTSTQTKIEAYLSLGLEENETDLPVHFSGFEHNILHAEFLTNHYCFTPQILKKIEAVKSFNLHKSDVDEILMQLFTEAYSRKIGNPEIKIKFNLNQVHSWSRATLINYVERLNRVH